MTKRPLLSLGLLALIVTLFFISTFAVDRSKFRTCQQTGFCRRNRSPSYQSQGFYVKSDSVQIDANTATLTAQIKNEQYPLQPSLSLQLSILANGVVRFKIKEPQPKHPRYEVADVLVAEALKPQASVSFVQLNNDAGMSLEYKTSDISVLRELYQLDSLNINSGSSIRVVLRYRPLSLELYIDNELVLVSNHRQLMQFEQYRDKNPRPQAIEAAENQAEAQLEVASQSGSNSAYPYDEDGMWEESFGGHTDSKPRGPSTVSMDFTHVNSQHVYGIPEHASTFALKNTDGNGEGSYREPYRLYNLDVFEFELNEPMSLYGAVPLIHSHNSKHHTAVLWLNAAETFVDVSDANQQNVQGKNVHWISESGVLEAFLFPGPTTAHTMYQYAYLTGFPALPQRFAIAYHQCRWNYKNEEDVAMVDKRMDESDIPYDVLWLDIEHTDSKKYLTWDRSSFPTPRQMQENLSHKGRKMVTIVDPHMKRDNNYWMHQQFLNKDLYVKKSNNDVYEGWCWPGSVSYPDFSLPATRDFWASQFAYNTYTDSTSNLYIWNDMNEPSVFNGPEVTMQKDMKHQYGQYEHRDVHNQYGFWVQMATQDGLIKRDNHQVRPFVLTRSFFSGTQRYGAVWTGDNKADWSHLESAQPMLLSLGMGGIVFSGADVGGFFNDPSEQLLVRWYQAGAYQPFFRGHAHIDTKRREPYLLSQNNQRHVRSAIAQRYALLPYLYSVFFQSSVTGLPVLRPLYIQFPQDSNTFAMEDSFMLGSALLIKPIVGADQTSTSVYLPGTSNDLWYDVHSEQSRVGGQTIQVDAPLERIPVFQRGGSIVTRRMRLRRASSLMEHDPFTLTVALDNKQSATSSFYYDDGKSFEYQQGSYLLRKFQFSNTKFTSTNAVSNAHYNTDARVERIIVLGLNDATKYKSALVSCVGQPSQTVAVYAHNGSSLTIRKPDCLIANDFSVELQA